MKILEIIILVAKTQEVIIQDRKMQENTIPEIITPAVKTVVIIILETETQVTGISHLIILAVSM